jgi:hypothetical protein
MACGVRYSFQEINFRIQSIGGRSREMEYNTVYRPANSFKMMCVSFRN